MNPFFPTGTKAYLHKAPARTPRRTVGPVGNPRLLTLALTVTGYAGGQWSAGHDWLFLAGWVAWFFAALSIGFFVGREFGRDDGFEEGAAWGSHPSRTDWLDGFDTGHGL